MRLMITNIKKGPSLGQLLLHIEKEIYANVSNGYECVFYIGTIIDIENLEKKVQIIQLYDENLLPFRKFTAKFFQ